MLPHADGQTKYAARTSGCCCSRWRRGDAAPDDKDQQDDEDEQQVQVFARGRFWRNRLARLWPVYFCTNLLVGATIVLIGGIGVDGSSLGVLGASLQAGATVMGVNTWFYPFVGAYVFLACVPSPSIAHPRIR
eukprot:SAG31_NODE_2366_length_5859_cov_4.794097_7_plen_133_part_00